MFDVAVRPRELLKWEIAPEFAIEAIPGDASESRDRQKISPPWGRERHTARGIGYRIGYRIETLPGG